MKWREAKSTPDMADFVLVPSQEDPSVNVSPLTEGCTLHALVNQGPKGDKS